MRPSSSCKQAIVVATPRTTDKMAAKQPLKTTFDVGKVIAPIFTGGAIAIDNNVSILATTLGEDVVLTNPSNGEKITTIEGVGFVARTVIARSSNRIV